MTGRRVRDLLIFGLAIQALGCRFGTAPGDGLGDSPAVSSDLADVGAGGSVAEQEELPSSGAAGSASPVGSARPSSPVSSATSGAPAGSGGRVSGAPPKPSSAGASGSASAPGKPAAADSCSKRDQIQVCDPISNTGCLAELGLQCDVDLLSMLTGACVFSAPPPDPSSCLAIFPTQTCPGQSTCVEGKCLKICVCDSDCEGGQRCATPLGTSGFKTCA